MVKKIFGALGIIIGVLLLVVVGYFIYVFNAYYRLEDNLELAIETPLAESGEDVTMVNVNETYRIITHNVGFGAYTQDFSFFMDGGTESWAASEDSVKEVIASAAQFAYSYAPDFLFVQELDIDSTRSYHVDEYALYRSYFKEYYVNFAQNYDSPFLMYPLTQPHGASKAGIATFTKYAQNDAVRRSFPISTGLAKLVDLDRCYSVTRIPTNNGKYLVLYNLHMSAYGSDETVREGQISMLCADMATEYAVGNYIICGGDFNHNLTLAEDAETTQSWAAPFPRTGWIVLCARCVVRGRAVCIAGQLQKCG